MLSTLQLRENVQHNRETMHMNDPFLVEGPAKGVHIGRHML